MTLEQMAEWINLSMTDLSARAVVIGSMVRIDSVNWKEVKARLRRVDGWLVMGVGGPQVYLWDKRRREG